MSWKAFVLPWEHRKPHHPSQKKHRHPRLEQLMVALRRVAEASGVARYALGHVMHFHVPPSPVSH